MGILGIFLIMGNAGFISSTVGLTIRGSGRRVEIRQAFAEFEYAPKRFQP